jgi:hypothetical protein
MIIFVSIVIIFLDPFFLCFNYLSFLGFLSLSGAAGVRAGALLVVLGGIQALMIEKG